MKDLHYITIKLLKKHTIPLMLLLVAMVLFFVNSFNRPIALAQEQIANVYFSVNVCNDSVIDNICSNNITVSNGKQTSVNFGEVDVNLKANTCVEIIYVIENIRNGKNLVTFNLNEENLINFKVDFFINNEFFGDLKTFDYTINKQDILKIKIVLSIVDVSQNACLNGGLNMIIHCLEVNDANS